MGSIGLSFGSPTSGQGFDVNATVSQIVTSRQNAESPYKTQLSSLRAQDTALSKIGGLLSTLAVDIQGLTDPLGVLSSKLGSSSDANTLELTSAGRTATSGSHTVTVQQLAQSSTVYSQALGAGDALSGSIALQVGSGPAKTVSVDPQNNTLSGLAASINAAGVGVTANVITDSTGSRLSLVSSASGAAGNLTVNASQLTDTTQSLSPSFITAQIGQDAQFVVDGVPVSGASNTVQGVIPGVTFQLLNTSSNPVQIQITNDTASVTKSLSSFVADYNSVVQALNAQEGNDASGNAQPLYGNPVISGIQQQLSGALMLQGSGNIKDLAQLGISVGNNGTLTLNTDPLQSALNAQYADVQSFFQGAGGVGFALAHAVDASGSTAPLGAITQASKANASIESGLSSTISTLDKNIAAQKSQLTAQLNAANQTLQMIPLQLNEVNEIYSAISGYNQKG